MTFADSVLQLVRSGGRAASLEDRKHQSRYDSAVAVEPAAVEDLSPAADPDDFEADDSAQEPIEYEPGLGDLEAAVALVSSGLANRVVLTGFPSWPGLLWRAYQLADTTGVLILPTVVRPGGKVDIAITRETATND